MKRNGVVSGVAAGVLAAGLGIGLTGFATGCKTGCPCGMMNKESKQMNHADFYKDGKFDAAKAKQAYFDMMTRFNVPIYAALKKDDPKATFADPQVVTKMFYEIEVVIDGKKHEVKVDAGGQVCAFVGHVTHGGYSSSA